MATPSHGSPFIPLFMNSVLAFPSDFPRIVRIELESIIMPQVSVDDIKRLSHRRLMFFYEKPINPSFSVV